MKIIKLSIITIALTSLLAIAINPEEALTNNQTEHSESSDIDKNLLLKKWKISHYEIFKEDYPPESIEKNDFIQFHKNGNYTSVSEGKPEKGHYKIAGQSILITNTTEEGQLKLDIIHLDAQKLSVKIDEPSDPDAKYVTIHFKS